MHETEEQLEAKYGSKYTATLASMETHLDTLIRTAVQRSVTQEQEQQMAASVRRMITADLETASAGVELHSPLLSSVNTSVKSFLMEDEEESQDMGDLIADSITALLDYDQEKDLQLHLVEKEEKFLEATIWESHWESDVTYGKLSCLKESKIVILLRSSINPMQNLPHLAEKYSNTSAIGQD